eukprot:scaffold206_cov400-Prasinococcus_capsulatus_cf.AAC.11
MLNEPEGESVPSYLQEKETPADMNALDNLPPVPVGEPAQVPADNVQEWAVSYSCQGTKARRSEPSCQPAAIPAGVAAQASSGCYGCPKGLGGIVRLQPLSVSRLVSRNSPNMRNVTDLTHQQGSPRPTATCKQAADARPQGMSGVPELLTAC